MCEHAWQVAGSWTGPHGLGCVQPLRLVCRACLEERAIACGSSRTDRCEPCGRVYRGRVGRVAGSGLVVGRRGLFVTLTAPGARRHRRHDGLWCPCTPDGGIDLAAWNASAGARWNRFVTALSRYVGADVVTYDSAGKRHRVQGLAYFKAAEVQRRGALHFHVLVRRRDGRPLVIARKKLRRLALRYGFGHSVDVQTLESGHASYVAKYVAKSANERGDVPWSKRAYRRPADRAHRVDRRSGLVIDRRTGEVVGPATLALVSDPTFRTWSASRAWGASMASVKADQRHYVMTSAELPCWAVLREGQWVAVREVPSAWGRVLAGIPPRPSA